MKRIYALFSAALLVAGLLAAPAAHAQLTIGAKGGLNVPKLSASNKDDTPLSRGYASHLAGAGGVFADYHITKTFSMQVGLEYQGQGGRKSGMQAVPIFDVLTPMMPGLMDGAGGLVDQAKGDGASQATIDALTKFSTNLTSLIGLTAQYPYLYADFKSVATFNYLMLPVQAKFGWRFREQSPVRVYVSAGVFGSWLMSARRVTSGQSPLYMDEGRIESLSSKVLELLGDAAANITASDPANPDLIDAQQRAEGFVAEVEANMSEPMNFDSKGGITSELRRFNFGFIGALGATYSFGAARRHAIMCEAGGNYGMVKMQNDPVNGQNRIGAGTISLGYAYTFGTMK